MNTDRLRTSERRALRVSDIALMIGGAAVLIGVLWAVAVITPRYTQAPVVLSHEEIVENARKAAVKAALAHREGSILVIDPEMCHEHSFDNWTGSIAYKDKVDCDERFIAMRKQEIERAAERMRSVSEGFRR